MSGTDDILVHDTDSTGISDPIAIYSENIVISRFDSTRTVRTAVIKVNHQTQTKYQSSTVHESITTKLSLSSLSFLLG